MRKVIITVFARPLVLSDCIMTFGTHGPIELSDKDIEICETNPCCKVEYVDEVPELPTAEPVVEEVAPVEEVKQEEPPKPVENRNQYNNKYNNKNFNNNNKK